MTATVNGIGTRYVGRTNVVERTAECRHCSKLVRLASYDTRTWFVVCFVPVIPLHKLRILDQCPRCTRHTIVRFAKWLEFQEEARRKASSRAQDSRNDPDGAIEAHRTLLGAHLMAEADALGTAMKSTFTDVAIVHAYLADYALFRGRPNEARESFARAHALDPDLPVAREGVARAAIADGDLDRALNLLRPVIEHGTASSPGPSCMLAAALVRAGRHAEAHPILLAMLARFPGLSRDKSFRKHLRACEKTLRVPKTKLARSGFGGRTLVAAGAVLAVGCVVGVVMGRHEHADRVTLYVVDSLEGRLVVEVPGGGMVQFDHPGMRPIVLTAGSYVAHVTGAVPHDVPFTIAAEGWAQSTCRLVSVLDASGGTVLCIEDMTYASDVNRRDASRRLVTAEPFSQWPDVDYAFQPFPSVVPSTGDGELVRKTRVGLLQESDARATLDMVQRNEMRPAFEFAQSRLALGRETEELLYGFVAAARGAHEEHRAEVYLTPRLSVRPADFAAHRAWQLLHEDATDQPAVIARYDELMATDPSEKAWSALRGLVSTSVSERLRLFESAARDTKLAKRVLTPLASTQASAGDWSAALDTARRALDVDPVDPLARKIVCDALTALGREAELEKTVDAIMASDPCNFDAVLRRTERLARSNHPEYADRALDALEKAIPKPRIEEFARNKAALKFHAAWARGDYSEALKRTARYAGSEESSLSAYAQLGDLKELARPLEWVPAVVVDPYTALAFALTCRAKGDVPQAARWERYAIERLRSGPIDVAVARILSGDRAHAGAVALDLDLAPAHKAIVLALVSYSDEGSRAKLLIKAQALQTLHTFPRVLIEDLASDAIKR